ncbi:hypothetical protein Aperf_G00000058042 [Anoplocephala perfoliata]
MKTSVVSTLLLMLAIAQTQAFYTLFEDEFARQQNRQTNGATAEAEANAEQQEPVEPAEPIPVSQRDINLLRRDILFSVERLRQTLESQSIRPLHMPNAWRYSYYPPNAPPQ